jgi:hypothetical protein
MMQAAQERRRQNAAARPAPFHNRSFYESGRPSDGADGSSLVSALANLE